MSRKFGPIKQNGYVVRDIVAAMKHWSEALGVGPWFYLGEVDDLRADYKGMPTDAGIRVALAYSGDLQIELIEPVDDHPSPYRDFLQSTAGQGGLHHICSWMNQAGFEKAVAEHQSEGGTIAYGGMTSGTRFAYFDASYDLGTMIEIAVLSDVSESFMDHIRTTAEDWDGTNPIRPVGNGKNEKTQLRN